MARQFTGLALRGAVQDAGDGTDFNAVQKNRVSITPLQIDLTHYEQLDAVKQWLL